MIKCIKQRMLLGGLCWLSLSLVLFGCATGGGSVDLGSVDTKPIIIKPDPAKPREDEVVVVPPKNDGLPKYGFAFKNPSARFVEDKKGKRWDEKYIENTNLVGGRGKEARESIMNLRAEDGYALDESTSLDEITLKHPTYWMTDKKDKYSTKSADKKISGLIPKDSDWVKEGDLMIYPDEDEYKALLNFDHTQLGFVAYKHTGHLAEGTLANATLFYRGINRAQSMPVSGSARYHGNWAYMTPMSYHEAQNGTGGSYGGHNLSLAHAKTSFVAEFDVNFGEKKLGGALKTRKDGQETEYFGIDAKIQGNQFSGKAVSKQNQDKALNKDSDVLFGGFYGDQGQELGGGFYTLANKNKLNGDKTLAVAFIAKKDGNGAGEAAKLSDGKLLSWEAASAKANITDLGYIDNIKQLGINDKGKRVVIDLNSKENQTINDMIYAANSCCENFQFLRFGDLVQAAKGADGKPSGNRRESLFVQGELTSPADVPTTGKAHYVGKWQMRTVVHSILGSDSDIPRTINGDASYHIDFGNKKLSGSLVGAGSLDAQGEVRPKGSLWININADIKGNQFSGKAEMPESKFVDTAYKSIHLKFDKVEGGLYGPGAAELGGHIKSTDGKTGVVFGGKKQAARP